MLQQVSSFSKKKERISSLSRRRRTTNTTFPHYAVAVTAGFLLLASSSWSFSPRHLEWRSPYCRRQQERSFVTALLLSRDDDNDDKTAAGTNDEDIIDNDTHFYLDLDKAKKAKLGADIPKQQLEESAAESQQEFLQALKEARQEFQDAKEKLGSQGAVDLFLDRIRKESNSEQEQQSTKDDWNMDSSNDNNDGDEGLGEFE